MGTDRSNIDKVTVPHSMKSKSTNLIILSLPIVLIYCNMCVCVCVQTSCLWDCCFACPLSSSSLSLSLLPLLCCSLNTDFSFPASIRKSRDVLVFMCSIRLTYPNNNFHYISFIIRSLRTQHMQCLYLHILISNISNRLSDHNFCNFTFDFLESWMRYFSNCSMA